MFHHHGRSWRSVRENVPVRDLKEIHSDLIGMARQTAILAFNFGDGFCNWVIPTSSALMAVFGIVNVPFDRWMRYSWRVFMWWVALGCVLVAAAQAIHLGPF